jgi:hypothetical protein
VDATAPLLQLKSFAQWLARHAGLVSSIDCRMTRFPNFFASNIDGLPGDEHLKAAEELLQLSIQAAATQLTQSGGEPAAAPLPVTAAPPVDAASGAAGLATAEPAALSSLAAAGQQQCQQQQGLCLRSFSSTLPAAVGMLAVLQSHSLTSLNLHLAQASADSSALSPALMRLSRLQCLRLDGTSHCNLGSALTALSQLSQLTSLHLSGYWHALPIYDWQAVAASATQPAAVALQQLLSQPLPLQKLQLDISCRLPA